MRSREFQVSDSDWLTEQLFFDAIPYFDTLVGDLDTANEEILLETYIFTLDPTGTRVRDALLRAAARNIRIRLLMDGIGSSDDAERIAESLSLNSTKITDTEVRIYHPLPWRFSVYRWALRRQSGLTKFWQLVTHINHRDHRKLCLIDSKIAWLGSFNITDGCIDGHRVDRHETGTRLMGEGVKLLREDFFHTWQHKQRRARPRLGNILSSHTRSYRRQKNRLLLKMIQEAKQRIWISNAYFAPSTPLINALKQAVKRHVDVQVIVPSRSDTILFPALTRTFYADLLAAGIGIHEYGRTVLHSKTLLIDQQLIVGSTNLNYRSYFHDMELDAILSHPETLRRMETKFRKDMALSEQMTLLRMKRFPRLVLWFGWLPRLLRYWF